MTALDDSPPMKKRSGSLLQFSSLQPYVNGTKFMRKMNRGQP
ncbi:hypothetical protein B4144_4258 [Bacillus atrophaeus]|nr:hypothetical protein B4144_4258 [Bacillus atrophaeus]